MRQPYFQIRSQSQVLRIRISPCEFLRGDTIQPINDSIHLIWLLWRFNKMSEKSLWECQSSVTIFSYDSYWEFAFLWLKMAERIKVLVILRKVSWLASLSSNLTAYPFCCSESVIIVRDCQGLFCLSHHSSNQQTSKRMHSFCLFLWRG